MSTTQRLHGTLDDLSETLGCACFFKDVPELEQYHIEVFSNEDHDGSSKHEFDVTYFSIESASDDRLYQLLENEILDK